MMKQCFTEQLDPTKETPRVEELEEHWISCQFEWHKMTLLEEGTLEEGTLEEGTLEEDTLEEDTLEEDHPEEDHLEEDP